MSVLKSCLAESRAQPSKNFVKSVNSATGEGQIEIFVILRRLFSSLQGCKTVQKTAR